jgi:CRP-like cAMP-binding protein
MEYIVDRVIALKRADIFKELSGQILANIAAILENKMIGTGEVLMSKGEIGDSMYFIQQGKIEVKDGDKVLATLGQNEIVGELSLLAPVNRTADVVAVEETTLYKIERDRFVDLIYEEPEIIHGIMKSLVYRIQGLNEKLAK